MTQASVLDLQQVSLALAENLPLWASALRGAGGGEIKIARERGQRLGCGQRACLSHDSLRTALRGPGCQAHGCKQSPASWERQKLAPEPQRDLCEASHPLPPPNVKASRRITLEKTVAMQRCRAIQEVAKARRVTNVALERKSTREPPMGRMRNTGSEPRASELWGSGEPTEVKEQGVWQPHTSTRSSYLSLYRIPFTSRVPGGGDHFFTSLRGHYSGNLHTSTSPPSTHAFLVVTCRAPHPPQGPGS